MYSNHNGFHGNGFQENRFQTNGFNNDPQNGPQKGPQKGRHSDQPSGEPHQHHQGTGGHSPHDHRSGGPSFHAYRPGHGWSFSAILRDLVATWRLIWDPKVPALLKICIPFLALLYFIWPLDLMPGLPFDDIAIVLLASRMFVRFAPPDRVNRAYPGSDSQSAYYDFRNRQHRNGKPTGDDDQDVIDTTWRVVDDKDK